MKMSAKNTTNSRKYAAQQMSLAYRGGNKKDGFLCCIGISNAFLDQGQVPTHRQGCIFEPAGEPECKLPSFYILYFLYFRLLSTAMLLFRKLKYLPAFFLALFFGGKCICQPVISKAVYKTTIGKFGYGYCCLLNDSSVIFVSTKSLAFSKTGLVNADLKDTIIKIGSGHWSIKDSFMFLHFKQANITVLNKNQLSYASSTEQPYDSLLLSLNVSKINDSLDHPYLLVLPGLMQEITSKRASITLPLHPEDTVVKIFMGYDKPFTIHLNEGNNKHAIDLKIWDSENDLLFIKEGIEKVKIYSKNKLPLKDYF